MIHSYSKRDTLLICSLLALVTFIVFSSTLTHDFVDFDDQDYVTQNNHVQMGITWQSVLWAFQTPYAANWHPLSWLSHMLDVQLFGLRPGWHHATNLLLHAANAVLLFLLLKRLTNALWRSAFVAGLFALHPLHVESIAWVSERKDVLSAFFFILTLFAYAAYAQSKVQTPESKLDKMKTEDGPNETDGRSRPPSADPTEAHGISDRKRTAWFYYSLALGLFAFGLMSKPMLVTLPFVLMLLDYWPLHRIEKPRANLGRLVLEKVPFLVLSAASSIITVYSQHIGGSLATMTVFPLTVRMANTLIAYARYLKKTVWPSDLAAYYPYPSSWPTALVILSGLLLVMVTIFVLRRRHQPHLLVGWLWFIGMLVPVIGVVQVGMQSIADRYMYLPLIGLLIMVAWAVPEVIPQRTNSRKTILVAAVAVFLACAATSAVQTTYWKDTESLFQRALRVTSDNALAEYSVGAAKVQAHQFAAALPYFERAAKIKPDYGEALNNLGMLLVMQGKTDEGIRRFHAALKAKFDTPELRFNLGSALASEGKFLEAVAEYESALRMNPLFSDARCQLGTIFLRQGKLDDARAQFNTVFRMERQNADAHIGLGRVATAEKNFDIALTEFNQALELRPEDPQAHFEAANVLAEAGRTNEAAGHYAAAWVVCPNLPALVCSEARASAAGGYITDAVSRYQAALRLTPDDPEIHHNLGLVLAQSGQIEDAVSHFKEALKVRPDARTHYSLALAMSMRGQRKASIAHYREALHLKPDWPLALNDLAWLLATVPDKNLRDGKEAVSLAERACELTGKKEPRFLGTLDAAYAENGRFADAISTASQAREFAISAGQSEVAQAAEKRVKLYEAGQAFRQN